MFYRSPLVNAMIKIASSGERVYAPDLLAHELGHAKIHGKSPVLGLARRWAPLAGSAVNVIGETPVGLAGHLVPISDEVFASAKAMKTLKDWGIDEENRRAASKRLGTALSSYVAGPAVDAGLTVGALATGNTAMLASAPVAGYITGRIVSPLVSKRLDKIPIEGISEERARILAKETSPDTNVYFSKKSFPGKGGYITRPFIRPSEKQLERMKVHKELGALIGRKASGRLLREGGVIVSPID